MNNARDAQNVPLGFKIDVIRRFYRVDRFTGRHLLDVLGLCEFHPVVAGFALLIERTSTAGLVPDPRHCGQVSEAMDALDFAHG